MEQKMKVGVAGSGAMGSGIAQVAAMAGHQVVIMDTNIEALSRSRVSIEKNLHKIVEKGKLTKEQSDLIEKRIKYSHSDQDFGDCGIVIEAIIEDLEVTPEEFWAAVNYLN